MPLRTRILFILFSLAFLFGAFFTFQQQKTLGDHKTGDIPEFSFYTNPGATTPQIPLWACQSDGGFELKTEVWRRPGDLHTALLAGRGDLWLGHVDGFARAREKGAPVVLLAVTGWRKMSIVTVNAEADRLEDFLGSPLLYAPRGTPAVPILKKIAGENSAKLLLEPQTPKQLALKMTSGAARSALLPEPLVSTLLLKMPQLRVALAIEDLYGDEIGGRKRIPWAGIAVHERLVKEQPERIARLLDGLLVKGMELEKLPAAKVAGYLPEEFSSAVPMEIVVASLERDRIQVEAASAVKEELEAYLSLIAPELGAWKKTGFIFPHSQD